MTWKARATGFVAPAALAIACVIGVESRMNVSALAPQRVQAPAAITATAPGPTTDPAPSAEPVGDKIGVLAIIAAAAAAGATAHAAGTEAAKAAYYAGLRNPQYQAVKWQIRALGVSIFGPVLGGGFMLGFQNQFYPML